MWKNEGVWIHSQGTVYIYICRKLLFLTFINQRCIKLIKSGSKDIYNVANDYYFK